MKREFAGVSTEDPPDIRAYLLHFGEGGEVDSHEVASTFPVDAFEDFKVLGGVCCEEVGGVGCVGSVDAFVGVGGWIGEGPGDHAGLMLDGGLDRDGFVFDTGEF